VDEDSTGNTVLSFLSKPSSSGQSYEAIEVHHARRVVHAVRSDSHTHRDDVADLVWDRADQPLNKVSRNGGHSISVVEAKADF
jgi:hypothetical protein